MAERDAASIAAKLPNYADLEAYTSFVVFDREEGAVQVGFGHRPMGNRSSKDPVSSETGATLVYSLGPTGHVATILYPAKSDVARVREELIFLRVKRIGALPLYECLAKDLGRLIAYERVTSLDTSPALADRLIVGWLRFWNRMQIGSETKGPRAFERAGQLASFSSARFTGALLGAVLKPVGVLVVAYLLIRFGMPALAGTLLNKG